MRRLLLWAPLALFALLLALVGLGLLRPADRAVHPAIVDRPLPDFALPALLPDRPGLARTSFGGGKPRVINLFGSWCVPCVAEAPELMKLRTAGVPVDGIAVNDTPDAVTAFLRRNGDPFERIGSDKAQRIRGALGASGVPETFLIDGNGRIVRHYVSNLQPDQVADIIAAWKALR